MNRRTFVLALPTAALVGAALPATVALAQSSEPNSFDPDAHNDNNRVDPVTEPGDYPEYGTHWSEPYVPSPPDWDQWQPIPE